MSFDFAAVIKNKLSMYELEINKSHCGAAYFKNNENNEIVVEQSETPGTFSRIFYANDADKCMDEEYVKEINGNYVKEDNIFVHLDHELVSQMEERAIAALKDVNFHMVFKGETEHAPYCLSNAQ